MEKAEGRSVTVRLDVVIGSLAVSVAVLAACCAGLAIACFSLAREGSGYEKAAQECHDGRLVAEAKVSQYKDLMDMAATRGGKGGGK